MTLPSSGPISFSNINTELGRSSNTTISITSAATNGYGSINTNSSSRPNNSQPHQLSEWYGYNHNAAPPLTSISLGYGATGFDACNAGPNTYWIANVNLTIGDAIYTDQNGNSLATAGWYSDNAITYYFDGSQVTTTGTCGGF